MTNYIEVKVNSKKLCGKVKVCKSFVSRAQGLMFSFDRKKGAVLVPKKSGRNSVHMLFVFRSLDIYWMDHEKRVLHFVNAKPFFPYYSQDQKASYVLELPSTDLKIQVGSRLNFNI